MAASSAPIVAVTTPGGFGKTIALSQWAESDPRRFAWLQADRADDDPVLFLAYLVAALGAVTDVDPMVTGWLQLTPPPVATRILPAVCAAVNAAAPFVLVIDDTHLITNDVCWQIVDLLTLQLPPGAQLCLSGRALPPLPLPRWRAEGRLFELGPANLALDAEETADLLQLLGTSATAGTSSRLCRITEGWATGVVLAALAGPRALTQEGLARIHGDRREIASYLASEVLERQPPSLARFLLRTSILGRLSHGVCRAVTGDTQAGVHLKTLARQGLFVSALDDADEWFRYHHLFAEFLQAELARSNESDVAGLHARAASWFESDGSLDEAVRHWLAAGDVARAGRIVCRVHMDYAQHARHETTRRWLEMFTDEQILSDPALTITAGFVGPMTGDTPRGRRWAAAALRVQTGNEEWPGANVPIRAMQSLLIASLAPEGVTEMCRHAALALALSDGVDLTVHAVAATLLGEASWLAGDNEAAARLLRVGEEEGAVAHCIAQVTAIGVLALSLADEGRWAEARSKTMAGLARFEEAELNWIPVLLPLQLARARLEARVGDPIVVDRANEIALHLRARDVPVYLTLLGDIVLGEIFVARGDLETATCWMHAGFDDLASYPDAGVLGKRLLRLREVLDRRRLIEPLTGAEHRVLELLVTQLTLKEIARRLDVSLETVRTHVRAIYRKLDAHVRSEAVARAHDLGLFDVD
ncbi:MAG TPA: LuxR C-terminal-related transcriptional regulator [Candidatus Limnocylindrales bacterium]|nr:LuxR C-terminal-related transcriptional regulator [Candidatus Limnocylindrales bacterium]